MLLLHLNNLPLRRHKLCQRTIIDTKEAQAFLLKSQDALPGELVGFGVQLELLVEGRV
jgi:hypothetical protein